MDLWLSTHDARVRALKERRELLCGFAETPFGGCVILIAYQHLLALYFAANKDDGVALLQAKWPGFDLRQAPEADTLISTVFENQESVPLMAIGTPFQLTVWEYLRGIPIGATVTYGDVARAIGRPTAARAVGRAVGANEISVLIPCHRVVSKGKLTGYRWGLERKRNLLAWELANRDPLEMPF